MILSPLRAQYFNYRTGAKYANYGISINGLNTNSNSLPIFKCFRYHYSQFNFARRCLSTYSFNYSSLNKIKKHDNNENVNRAGFVSQMGRWRFKIYPIMHTGAENGYLLYGYDLKCDFFFKRSKKIF